MYNLPGGAYGNLSTDELQRLYIRYRFNRFGFSPNWKPSADQYHIVRQQMRLKKSTPAPGVSRSNYIVVVSPVEL
jgi:hypothetical protein